MRHRVGQRKLGRTTSHRLAMLRNMATSLLLHERIRTTDAKAKEVRRVAEKMITLGKRGDLHARRLAAAFLRGKEVTKKVFSELADRYKDVPGGYTRIVKLGPRKGDGAMMSIVELVRPGEKEASKRKPAKRSSRAQSTKQRASRREKGEAQGAQA
jgi:large subunit ribosomal protein L17